MKKADLKVFLSVIVIFLLCSFTIIASYVSVLKFISYSSSVFAFLHDTSNILSLLLGALVIFTAVVMILERRDPTKTLSWLLIIIFLPVIGFLLYLYLGRQFRKRRMTAKKRVLNHYIYPLDDEMHAGINAENSFTTKSKERLMYLIMNNAEFPLTLHNDVDVLTDGAQIFSAFFSAIKRAKEHIHLETYILRDDQIGKQLFELLIKKAREGVHIRIIYDGLGSRELSRDMLNRLTKEGIGIKPFFPVRLPLLHSRINYRNHRKILVVDGADGFVGGVNIGDEYLCGDPQLGYWRETHLHIHGNAVHFLQRIFLQDWYFVTKESLEDTFKTLFPIIEPQGNKAVQITASGPDTHWEAIMQVYYYAITTAEESIYLTSPYFVPNESILTALKTAALSGVDVKIVLPAETDHKMVFWAGMSYLEELMEAGVEIYLYQKGFIHSKVLIIDGIVSSIGSANMDQRSFSLNFEVNALIYNQSTTQRLKEDFIDDLTHSQQLDLKTFTTRPLPQRVLESSARLLSPLL